MVAEGVPGFHISLFLFFKFAGLGDSLLNLNTSRIYTVVHRLLYVFTIFCRLFAPVHRQTPWNSFNHLVSVPEVARQKIQESGIKQRVRANMVQRDTDGRAQEPSQAPLSGV